MKYTVSEFAQEIRKMYPGDYDDLSDSKLVELWLKKYPNDREKISLLNIRQTPFMPSKKQTSKESSSLSSVLVLAVISVILIFSNPSQEKHVKEATIVIKNAINKSSSKNLFGKLGNDDALIGGLGLLFGDGLVDGLVPKFISRKNYLLFSLTSLSYDGKDQIIGIGILGNVFISDKVEQELDKLYNKGADAVSKYSSQEKKSTIDQQSKNNSNDENVETDNETNYNSTDSDYENFQEYSSGYYYIQATESSLVYIYASPDLSTRKNAYFDSQERVYINEFKNGFGYIEFTNSENQTSTGWLLLSELKQDN